MSKEKLQKEAEIRRLKEEDAKLMERKQKLQRRVQRHSVYQDFMEQVVKMTKVLQDFHMAEQQVTKFVYHTGIVSSICQYLLVESQQSTT